MDWLDEKEEDIMQFPLVLVVQDRGRENQPDTNCAPSFTTKQLDTVARLTYADRKSIREGKPSEHARQQIRRRIQLAQYLKYEAGTHVE